MAEAMLIGALIFAAGTLAGRFLPSRRRGPKPPKPVQPVCGCSHHHSFHDPKAGECHGTRDVAIRWDTYGNERAWKQEPCTCRQYSGPVPLPEYMVQEIAGGGDG